MNELNDLLEIIIITYNRKEHLNKTLEQIFSFGSPIKNLQITILNNKSTDGTTELIHEYSKNFSNIKHIIHNRNIGGNANIARAFEIASKKYFWILCDDDEYKWENWEEVTEAIKKDYDAIVVANYMKPKEGISNLLKQLTFVPAAIYKTENITDTVMDNIEFCQSFMFGQLALGCALINQNKKIYICENWFVKMAVNIDGSSYIRGCDNSVHPYKKLLIWHVGYINTIQLINDEKRRKLLLNESDVDNRSLFWGLYSVIFQNKSLCRKYRLKYDRNLHDVFNLLDLPQRILYMFALVKYNLEYRSYRIKKEILKIFYGKERTQRLYELSERKMKLKLLFKNKKE